MLDTPDYTVRRMAHVARGMPWTNNSTDTETQDTETGVATTDHSVAGDVDGRKKRWEGNALRKSVLGKKHDRLGESKVRLTAIRDIASSLPEN